MKQEIPNMLDISINLDHSHLWGPLYFLDMKSIESYERAHLLENGINILIERNGIKNQCTNISTS